MLLAAVRTPHDEAGDVAVAVAKSAVACASLMSSMPAPAAASRSRSISSAPDRLGSPCMRSAEWPG